jgi:hypothetical protein
MTRWQFLMSAAIVAQVILLCRAVSSPSTGDLGASPEAVLIDQVGYQSHSLDPIVIAVLEPSQNDAYSSMVRATTEFRQHHQVVAFATDDAVLPSLGTPNLTVLRRPRSQIVLALRARFAGSRWIVLDRDQVVSSGSIIAGGLEAAVARFHSTVASRERVISERFRGLLLGGALPIPGIGRNPHDEQVLVILDIIRSTCPLFDALRRAKQGPAAQTHVIVAVPATWSEASLRTVSADLDPSLRIQRLSPAATAEWARLVAQFGPSLADGIAITVRGDSVEALEGIGSIAAALAR